MLESIPSIFIVVPSRNRKHKTLRFLSKIHQQTYSNFTVIVVDSHSTDGTPDAIKQSYPDVVVINASDHDYWAGATNIGIRFALRKGCDFVFTINDDSIVKPDHIKRLVELACCYNLSILGSRIDYLSHPGLVWSLGTSSNWGSTKFIALNYNKYRVRDLPRKIHMQDHMQVDALVGNGVLLHRSVYEKIGLYNTIFTPHYHADTELTLRANTKGFTCWVAPQVVLLNDFSDDQKNLSLRNILALYHAFFKRKSHLFIWPWIYLFLKYCPKKAKVKTLSLAISRLVSLYQQ